MPLGYRAKLIRASEDRLSVCVCVCAGGDPGLPATHNTQTHTHSDCVSVTVGQWGRVTAREDPDADISQDFFIKLT